MCTNMFLSFNCLVSDVNTLWRHVERSDSLQQVLVGESRALQQLQYVWRLGRAAQISIPDTLRRHLRQAGAADSQLQSVHPTASWSKPQAVILKWTPNYSFTDDKR